jgi:hypothetical protein
MVMPDPDYTRSTGSELRPLSYDAEQLEKAVNDVTNTPSTLRQAFRQYEFRVDYLLADTDDMTYQELLNWADCMMVHIDTYFFRGGLTQGNERYLSLRLHDKKTYPLAHGFCEHSIVPLQHRIFFFTADAQTGRRRPKISLLTTLLHDMAHAYIATFFNFCPENGEVALVNNDGHGHGHGVLWQRIYGAIHAHVRTWDPAAFDKLNVEPPKALPEALVRAYYGIAGKLPWLRDAWDVMDLADDEPRLFPPAMWRIAQKEEFRRSGLRLADATYEQFVWNRVPYPADFFRLVGWGVLLSFLLLLSGCCLVWRNECLVLLHWIADRVWSRGCFCGRAGLHFLELRLRGRLSWFWDLGHLVVELASLCSHACLLYLRSVVGKLVFHSSSWFHTSLVLLESVCSKPLSWLLSLQYAPSYIISLGRLESRRLLDFISNTPLSWLSSLPHALSHMISSYWRESRHRIDYVSKKAMSWVSTLGHFQGCRDGYIRLSWRQCILLFPPMIGSLLFYVGFWWRRCLLFLRWWLLSVIESFSLWFYESGLAQLFPWLGLLRNSLTYVVSMCWHGAVLLLGRLLFHIGFSWRICLLLFEWCRQILRRLFTNIASL